MAAEQIAGTPTETVADSPLAAADQSIEEMLNEAIDAQPADGAPDAPAKPDDVPAEPAAVLPELTDAALEKALATPEGRKAAIRSIREAEAKNRKKYLSLKGWEGKLKAKSATAKREVESFTSIRDAFMADVSLATRGTTEEAINALTRIRAGAGQKGEDFLTEAQLAVAKNGKKTIDPEVAELKAKLAKMESDAGERETKQKEGQLTAAEQRRLAEVGAAVAQNPALPTCAELGQRNGKQLQDMAMGYKQAFFDARGSELPDADAAKLVERDMAQLRAFPHTLAYAKLGNLPAVVSSVVNLAKTQGLDDGAALGRIEAELRSYFGGATPQGDAGRAPSAQAAPDGQAAMPGRSPSARASATGAMRAPTPDEDVEQFSDLFDQLGM